MANTAQARKRVRQADKARIANTSIRTKIRTWVKRVKTALVKSDAVNAELHFKTTQKELDKAATKGLIQKNTAARYKSRLNKRIKALKAV